MDDQSKPEVPGVVTVRALYVSCGAVGSLTVHAVKSPVMKTSLPPHFESHTKVADSATNRWLLNWPCRETEWPQMPVSLIRNCSLVELKW